MLGTADSKIKSQKDQVAVEMFRKLEKKEVGLNDVETFARKSSRQGSRMEARRKGLVRRIMREKRMDAEIELRWSRERYKRRMAKLEARWGHYREVMVAFRNILNHEATEVWSKVNAAESDMCLTGAEVSPDMARRPVVRTGAPRFEGGKETP